MRLSIIVPTINRPTLSRCLESIKPQPEDEVLVVSTVHESRSIARSHGCKYFDYPFTDSIGGGAMERTYGIQQAKGDWLVFLDDDDIMAPEGLEIIREEIGKLERLKPLLFRIQIPGGFIWSEQPSLTLGEVSGSQFVCPRNRVAEWPRDTCGDQPFIFQTINLWGGYKPVDRVIVICRPEQI